MRELKIGDEVYYSVEDYDTGNDVIYKAKIVNIIKEDIHLGDTILKDCIFYKLDNGTGVQRNACYTIDELFQLKERLEELLDTTNIYELLRK